MPQIASVIDTLYQFCMTSMQAMKYIDIFLYFFLFDKQVKRKKNQCHRIFVYVELMHTATRDISEV